MSEEIFVNIHRPVSVQKLQSEASVSLKRLLRLPGEQTVDAKHMDRGHSSDIGDSSSLEDKSSYVFTSSATDQSNVWVSSYLDPSKEPGSLTPYDLQVGVSAAGPDDVMGLLLAAALAISVAKLGDGIIFDYEAIWSATRGEFVQSTLRRVGGRDGRA